MLPSVGHLSHHVLFDSQFCFEQHIEVVRCVFTLEISPKWRPTVNRRDSETFVHAFISSHLDCETAFLLVPHTQIKKQNPPNQTPKNSAELSSETFNPVWASLHWLPVSVRIERRSGMSSPRANLHGKLTFIERHFLILCELSCDWCFNAMCLCWHVVEKWPALSVYKCWLMM